ncbi:MAG: M15 family metallopeptidase [Candidatus Ancillula sp.]|jgi:D-alanyl-D-alanine carboxypeptidase|nr:M15 family metallopeptidase [Candidatus Ancillula sp.]
MVRINPVQNRQNDARKKLIIIIISILAVIVIGVGVFFGIKAFAGNPKTLDSTPATIQDSDSEPEENEVEPEPIENSESSSDKSDSDTTSNKDENKEMSDSNGTPETVKEPFSVESDGVNVIIANKKHALPDTWNPGEDPTAVRNLHKLISAGQKAGIDLIDSWSGFRSYDKQVSLYNSYVARDGKKAADTYSARPGYSEHQTGLAFDLLDSSSNLYRGDDSSYNYKTDWVYKNAHKYGFIVRYLAKDQDITGYEAEPWHVRYLGVDLATKVYESGKCLEEYLGVSGGDYISK